MLEKQGKQYRCGQCGQSFQNEQDLQRHEAQCRQQDRPQSQQGQSQDRGPQQRH
jgi:hypothetical protein